MAKKKVVSDQTDVIEENYDMAAEPTNVAEPEIPNDPSTFNEEEGTYRIGEVVVDTGVKGDGEDDYSSDSTPINVNDYEEIDDSKEAKTSKLLTQTPDEEAAAGFIDEDPWLEKMDYDPDNAGLEE